MVLAGAFAIVLFVGLIIGDWVYFGRLSSDAARYGYGLGRVEDQFSLGVQNPMCASIRTAFWLRLMGLRDLSGGESAGRPSELSRFSIGPHARPLQGLYPNGHRTWMVLHWLCTKRTPWSSSILTLCGLVS